MKNRKELAVCVVADFKFLFKYFNSFKDSLRNNGKYKGDIVIITSIFSPTFIFWKILFDRKVHVVRLKKIKFSKSTSEELKNLNTNGQPNRHINKNFQWHKINLFNRKLKKWKFIFYLDINMIIHFEVNKIFEFKPKNKIFARADGYPEYKWTLDTQFDQTHFLYEKLNKIYDLSLNNYFQTGILYFDTNLIEKETVKNLINLVETFPLSITNEQGIMNLYFIFDKNVYQELPEEVDDCLVYYYWLTRNKKTLITKQNSEKYK